MPSFVTMFLVACLDVSSPESCVAVEVPGLNGEGPQVSTTLAAGQPPLLVPLSFGSCTGHEGQAIARDFMAQHPTYGRPEWRFGGVRCQVGPRRSSA